jgi:hypothetical protein
MRKPKPINSFQVTNHSIRKKTIVDAYERSDAISKAKRVFEKKYNLKAYCHDLWVVVRLTNRKYKLK